MWNAKYYKGKAQGRAFFSSIIIRRTLSFNFSDDLIGLIAIKLGEKHVSKQKKDFLLVSKNILPDAIIKTAKAKELLAKFEVLTINEACERVEISRSAFYKYKDGVLPFYEASKEKIITLSLLLVDKI